MKRVWMNMVCLVLFILIFPYHALATRTHDVYFEGTDYELDVYKIYGDDPGPTLLIMGGIQGNEPGGYLAADLYVDMGLKRGNLIVVPRANLYSILVNQRGPNGDMNRKFADVHEFDLDSEVVKKIKELMEEADYFLNMHDGSGFYHPEYIDNMHNPRRFGQSIIVDTDRYTTSDGKEYNLEAMAKRIIDHVNSSIHEPEYRFHFNNHKTASKESVHKEQRKSATFYMLTRLNKPAFASETSKSIKDFRKRVVFQTMVVNEFMKEIGIEPSQPSIYIDPPIMEYVLISLNHNPPMALQDEQRVVINKGDIVAVTDIKANYKRGVVADIKGKGYINDTGKGFILNESTIIEIKKDMFPCGKVYVDVIPCADSTWLILEANDVCYAVRPEEVLSIQRGSVLILKDLIYRGSSNHGLNVNFKGFVSNWDDNTGEDRGYRIDTASLLTRYAHRIDTGISRYRISAMRGDTAVANFFIDLCK